MEFFAELDAVRERWNVLDHPFYTRWSEGTLTHDELAYYSGQYRHAVVALAAATRRAADAEIVMAGSTAELMPAPIPASARAPVTAMASFFISPPEKR